MRQRDAAGRGVGGGLSLELCYGRGLNVLAQTFLTDGASQLRTYHTSAGPIYTFQMCNPCGNKAQTRHSAADDNWR